MNNKEYQLHMVKIVVKACKTLEHMQSYVKENRISQISFIEYYSLLKTLYNEHFIDDEDILSYANSLLNASVIIKQEDIYNQIIEELNKIILSITGNLDLLFVSVCGCSASAIFVQLANDTIAARTGKYIFLIIIVV